MAWGQRGNFGGGCGGGGGAWGAGGKGGAAKPIAPKTAVPGNVAQKPGLVTGSMVRPSIGSPTSAPSKSKPVYTVTSQSKKDEIGVLTLVGDFTEVGTNHGRKYYQKVQEIPGHKGVKVFLYYWDNRDGADFSGWWFGDELGGSQVWARCGSHGNVPPPTGWKIPWDAPKAEPGMLAVNAYKGNAVASNAAPASVVKSEPGVAIFTLEARIKKADSKVDGVEKTANLAAQKAKVMTKDTNPAVLKTMQATLTTEQTKLTEAQKALTQDITEARKAGPAGAKYVGDLSRLSPRIRTATALVNTELNKIKGFATATATALANTARDAELKKKNAANQEQVKKQEVQNAKDFKEMLPGLEESVNGALDAMEAVGIMAGPIENDPPEDAGEALIKVTDEIEAAANDAQTKVTQSRQQLNNKNQAARMYAPEARKTALAAFATLQGKLAEAQKKLNPYKNFKRDFSQRVEAKKALAELAGKLGNADLEVEKASLMTSGADDSQMSLEDVIAGEQLVTPAQTALRSVSVLIEGKMRNATGPMKDELTTLKERLTESQKTVNGVAGALKLQREGLALQGMYVLAQEKVEKAEESIGKCSEAELSFLKGIEILPQAESEKAIKDSEAAAAESTTLLQQAQNFLRQKLLEVKKHSPATAKKATEELTAQQKKCEAVQKKLTIFKSDTKERKVAALMGEAIDAVITAETKVKALSAAGKIFDSDSLDSTSASKLKEAGEKTAAADKECSAALAEARKIVTAKQRMAKDQDTIQAFGKLSARINVVQQEVSKVKKAAASGDRLVKGKEVIADAEVKLVEVEADVNKIVKMSNPDDDGLGVETVSDDTILDIHTMSTASAKLLRSVSMLVQSQLASAPPAIKTTLTKLAERSKKCESALAEVRASTAEQREQVLSQNSVKEGLAKTLEVEAALDKVELAEQPYLKGIEILPADESKKAMAAADEATQVVGDAISVARNLIATKNIDLRKFDPKNSKASVEELTKLTERVNSAAQKLGIFKRDTESRRKIWQMQEAPLMVVAVEAEVEKVSAAMKALMEKDLDELSPEAANTMVEGLEELEKSANKQMTDCRAFLAARSRDAQGDKEKVKMVQDLQAKITAAQQEVAKARKLSSGHKEKLMTKKEQKEADAITVVAKPAVEKVEAELKRLEEAAKPLVELHGTELLNEFATPISVQDAVVAINTALKAAVAEAKTVVKEQQEHVAKAIKGPMLEAKKELQKWLQKSSQAQLTGIKAVAQLKSCCNSITSAKIQLAGAAMRLEAKGTSADDFFKKLAKGSNKIAEADFVKHVQKLKGLNLPKEQAQLVVDRLEAGGVGHRSFVRFLQQYFKVIKEIAITPNFEIVGTRDKPVRKAECEEVFEVLEGPTHDGASGLERVKVRALTDSSEGWVSLKGNQGKIFLTEVEKPFYQCLKDSAMEKDFASGSGEMKTVGTQEVLELIEGPRKEILGSVMRCRGKAVSSGKVGWFTMKDKNGVDFVEKGNNVYTCTATAAITDVFDIKACKVLRKLAVDEIFTITEGPTSEEGSSLERVKARSTKGEEGWVTIKGNAGSVFCKVNESLVKVTQDVALQSQFRSDSSSVATLSSGEAVEVLEGPKEEKFVPVNRVKVRTSTDASIGWITVKPDNMKPWTPFYKFLKLASLYASRGSKETTIREVNIGEVLELQDGPVEVDGKMWLKGRMKKDNAVGWAQMNGDDGAKLLTQGQ